MHHAHMHAHTCGLRLLHAPSVIADSAVANIARNILVADGWDQRTYCWLSAASCRLGDSLTSAPGG